MATYAIGDVQGCYDELQQLLGRVSFHKSADRLWFVGDLVNRGPKSLDVLRFVRDLADRAVVVLGNHDLHLVAQHEAIEGAHAGDTFDDVLQAPDAADLVGWLRRRPMMHAEGSYAMVHAGLLPQWSIAKALSLAREVDRALAGPTYPDFLQHMYGAKPDQWDDALAGWDRLRVIVNAMTRMRFCDRAGRIDLKGKGTQPRPGYLRWYETRPRNDAGTLLFGHWSQHGLVLERTAVGLDSGCVWGGALSALRLEDRTLYQVACPGYQTPGGEA
ncbi:MAG TPA: symmetrical bis(5'-nucleosyl)-tetraphosphatase [Burkholderiales bacterium]|jgi:bis(5'-nucleosyl)-tetraphosphatase (symmetrical)|nr:symmetrical bis(5'-nucleosyl)-tetraphosphatase [Burkholderiales bacterium]